MTPSMKTLLALAMCLAVPASAALAQGLTEPRVLPPFTPGNETCSAPAGLEKRLLFLQDNERDFILGVKHGLGLAAQQRNLAFSAKLASNDATRMQADARAALAEKVGAVIAAPINPEILSPDLRNLLLAGTYVGTIVPPPASTILNAPQYETGRVLGDAAADYIRSKLGGKADVVIFTHDSLQVLAPRFRAIRDALDSLPGVDIIADITPDTVDRAGGSATMQNILLANPNVDVVLGADTVVLGAYDAMKAAGKLRDDQFFGGIDGEPDAVRLIKAGGAYKLSVSLASPVFGYALGSFAADWLEGKAVPQAMDILPRALTAQNIAAYEADLQHPDAVFADPARRDSYLRFYGRICYDTRSEFLDFPWSSEQKDQD